MVWYAANSADSHDNALLYACSTRLICQSVLPLILLLHLSCSYMSATPACAAIAYVTYFTFAFISS